MDDSHVSQVSQNEVLNQKAYVLFYIRLAADGVQQTPSKLVPQMVCLSFLFIVVFILKGFFTEFKCSTTKTCHY